MKIQYYVYILINSSNKVLYDGVTNDLERRNYEHKQKLIKGFTKKYNVDKLIYFEEFDSIELAIFREKQIKEYSRSKKMRLLKNQIWNGKNYHTSEILNRFILSINWKDV